MKDAKEALFELDLIANELDIKNRIVYVTDEILETTPAYIMSRIRTIMSLSEDEKTSITLEISSPGGSVSGTLGLIDSIEILLKEKELKINTTAVGEAMSGGAWLLIAGTGKRAMTKHTTIMFHQSSTFMGGKTDDIEVGAKNLKATQEILNKLLVKCSSKPETFWKEKIKNDFFVTAKEALEYGLIDKIL